MFDVTFVDDEGLTLVAASPKLLLKMLKAVDLCSLFSAILRCVSLTKSPPRSSSKAS